MVSRSPRALVVVGLTAAALALLLGSLAARVGRPYPGFFVAPDYRVFPVEAGVPLEWGDRIVGVDGRSPTTLEARMAADEKPVRYEIERSGRRATYEVAPRPFTWPLLLSHFGIFFAISVTMLAVGVAVFAQSRLAACLVGFISIVLSVHGWVFFLTYPVNPSREAWLERHRVIPLLYTCALVLGSLAALTILAPEMLADGWVYPASVATLFTLAAISFPIKIAALLDTRRRADSPLVNQEITVLLLGIGFGLGGWLAFMLAPLSQIYRGPFDPQWGSALVLLYPLAIAYATVRYRLFDATVVIRRSVVYAALAGLITAAYALAIAGANLLLAQANLAESTWFSAAFMFAVALAFNPLRERLRRLVDRTFFRERYDYVRTIGALARSMSSLLDLGEIERRLTTTIETAMHVVHARLEVGAPQGALEPALRQASGALSRYQLAADPRFAEVEGGALGAYAAMRAEVLVPLRFQQEIRGLLVLGAKRSEAPYTAEDLELLETLADQTAVAVANAEAHQQVLDYARQLERSLLIRGSLAKFVPQRVRELIEESPEAPSLDKRETDVSVLFADISGYTRLSSRLAPDDLDALVQRYFGAFLDEIVKHGGDVNETAGDGLMVIFHEGDHARAAVDAARAIHRRAAEIGAQLAHRFDPLRMHIGVNTGPALLGATKIEGRAGTRWTYTASGMTTNIAARLAAQAQGGEIVLSGETRARLYGDLALEEMGLRELKGVEQPLPLYRLR